MKKLLLIICLLGFFDCYSNTSESILNVKDFGAKGNGIADDTQSFKDALYASYTKGLKLIVPSGTYKIYKPLNLYSPNLEGETGAKIVFADNLVLDKYDNPLNPKRQMLMYNGSFNNKENYDEKTADVVRIKNILFISEVLNMPGTFRNEGSILGLANVKEGIIDNCTFAIYNNIKGSQLTPLDWFNGVNNVTVTNTIIINKNPQPIGGGVWVRTWNQYAPTQNNIFRNCRFEHQSGDEAIAVFALNGAVKNTVIDKSSFISLREGQPHTTLVSFFPSGNYYYKHSEINGIVFTNNTIEDYNFKLNCIRSGQLNSAANRICDNILVSGNNIKATPISTRTGTAVIRKIKCIGDNFRAENNTITMVGEFVVNSIIREVDIVKGNTLYGNALSAINTPRVVENNVIKTKGDGIRYFGDKVLKKKPNK